MNVGASLLIFLLFFSFCSFLSLFFFSSFLVVSLQTLNPMAPRILTLFQNDAQEDAINAGGVTFDIFVRTLNFFNARTPLTTKLKTLFRAYDVDGDGLVSERDLGQMLKYYTGPHLSEATCKVLVRKTMEHALERLAATGGAAGPKKKAAAAKRNSNDDEDEAPTRGLTFEEFAGVVGQDGSLEEIMAVRVPLRHDE